MRLGLPPAELLEAIKGFEAIVVRSETKVTAAVIEAGKRPPGCRPGRRRRRQHRRRGGDAARRRRRQRPGRDHRGDGRAHGGHDAGAGASHPGGAGLAERRRLGALEVRRRGAARQDARHHRPRPHRRRGRAAGAGAGDAAHRPRPVHLAGARRLPRRRARDERGAARGERFHHHPYATDAGERERHRRA